MGTKFKPVGGVLDPTEVAPTLVACDGFQAPESKN